MPLVKHYKHVRILKAQRKRSPLWQREDVPTTTEGKETYAIAAKHEQRFSRAFLSAMRSMLTSETRKDFNKAWKSKNVQKVMEVFPFFRAGAKDVPEVWEKFVVQLVDAYRVVVQEAGAFVTEEMNEDFNINMRFSLVQKKEELDEVQPPNAYSIPWIEARALELIKQDITKQQRKVVRNLIKTNFARGTRAEAAFKEIQANIGLTEQWQQAVETRRELLLDSGMSEELAEKKTSIYRDQLLRKRAMRIARTETITAQARGRQDAWKAAEDAGLLPEVERVWLTAPAGCPICDSLDGKAAELGKPYASSYGSFMGPGSDTHPQCRCSEKLRRVGAAEKPKPEQVIPIEAPPKKPRPSKRPLGGRRRKKPSAPSFTPRPKAPIKFPEKRSFLTMPRTGTEIELSGQQRRIDQIARYVKGNEARFRSLPREARAEYMQWNWVHGSNRKMSIRMKEAAKREFNLKGMVYNKRGFKISDNDVNYIRKEMRSVYENTQKELAKRGIKSVKVYRGLKSEVSVIGDMESWTTDLEKAKSFGSNVLTKEVPVSKIYTYEGSANWVNGVWGKQKEVIVME